MSIYRRSQKKDASTLGLISAEENCKKQLESGTCNLHEDRLLCNQCYRKVAAATTSTPKTPTQEYVNVEDPDCCPRCGKRVYFAEQMQCLNRKWHKQCLCCGACQCFEESCVEEKRYTVLNAHSKFVRFGTVIVSEPTRSFDVNSQHKIVCR